MFIHLYQNIVLRKPKIVIAFLIFTLLGFGYFSKDFKLDASSDTLLIDGDPDLKYLKEINNRYGSKEFLVLTFTPNENKEHTINIAANRFTDTAGNSNSGSNNFIWTYDTEKPTMTITSSTVSHGDTSNDATLSLTLPPYEYTTFKVVLDGA